MYKLKTIARRSTLLGAASALAFAAVLPAALASAQALNPLTERSLLLSSSAPGYIDTDGSGYNSSPQHNGGTPNPAGTGVYDPAPDSTETPYTYAPAGSGPNGKRSGQTFSFRASSSASVKGLTFQYCTTAAGNCQAPGNNTGDAKGGGTRQSNTGEDGGWAAKTSDLDVTGSFVKAVDEAEATAGQFQIKVNGNETATDDWSFEADNWEDEEHSGALTGKNNLITLRSTIGTQINAGDRVEVKFVASEDIFITNPGKGHFFVKINTYNDGSQTGQLPNAGASANIVDGGVTVANVMTDSIHITTKVLETMAFSVGTQNPDKVTTASHGTCDAINQINNNRLNLGNPDAEYSLETSRAWDVYSYWRLSSNSSGGATVYYSGNTLANTVGDEIAAMTTKAQSLPGTEQFGLGFVDPGHMSKDPETGDDEAWSPAFVASVEAANSRYKYPNSFPFITLPNQVLGEGDFAGLNLAQSTSADYRDADGELYVIDGNNVTAGDAEFKFLPSSLFAPEPIAQQNETVISCATAKMRYVGNIGADTPAGVYTTKVNYLAAPQY